MRGRLEKTVSLSFVERSLMQRVNMYAIGGVLLLTTVAHLLPPSWELPIVLVAAAIMFIPVRYFFTTEGVAVNNVVFRPWTEFRGFSVERRRIVLEGQEGMRSLSLTLLPGKQEDVLPLLRQHLKPIESNQDSVTRAVVQHVR